MLKTVQKSITDFNKQTIFYFEIYTTIQIYNKIQTLSMKQKV